MTDKILFENVGLSFGKNNIFKNVFVELDAGKIIGITGKNGSGKSTFLKLAGKIINPDEGEVKICQGSEVLKRGEYKRKIAAVTPELKIYDELTAIENLYFFAKLRGVNLSDSEIFAAGEKIGLDLKKFENVRTGNFSTGMHQRLKFAVLMLSNSDIWLLDEPTANLDDDGREKFFCEIRGGANSGKLILIATNDSAEVNFCDEIISLPFGCTNFGDI